MSPPGPAAPRGEGRDRFLADASLELVARRLRALGFDVRPAGHLALERLLARARSEDAIALTLSARRPRRFADVPALRLPRDPAAAVRAVAERYRPAGAPFSRCTACNLELVSRPAAEAPVPPAVRRSFERLDTCTGCGRWYWPGSHVARLRAWLESALGRPLALVQAGRPPAGGGPA